MQDRVKGQRVSRCFWVVFRSLGRSTAVSNAPAQIHWMHDITLQNHQSSGAWERLLQPHFLAQVLGMGGTCALPLTYENTVYQPLRKFVPRTTEEPYEEPPVMEDAQMFRSLPLMSVSCIADYLFSPAPFPIWKKIEEQSGLQTARVHCTVILDQVTNCFCRSRHQQP